MASMLHACPYCGYETEIVNVLPAFSENPHCQRLALFEQADREQKARLVELWQISPPTFGNPSSLQPFANSLPAAECSQLDSFGKALDPHNDVMMDEDSTNSCDTHAAEPYVVSGYEMLAQREYNLPTQPSLPFPRGNCPAEIPSSATYNPSTDPVYKREDRQETQPIEHQYGAFEMKNYYIGCGVARAHWLEDQHFF
ncbi:hypothetical protein CIHG_06384 [Coccidioides immitis H538.4]|uniref:Uncharacterized protein n=1 Tax=Coccidioides immitis H538.4 TaxID=396776 RepID=A0A0J8RVW5_COCIT|nr:hypothetical protein CIHG_06384 [Coccidioides immitis H538.4]